MSLYEVAFHTFHTDNQVLIGEYLPDVAAAQTLAEFHATQSLDWREPTEDDGAEGVDLMADATVQHTEGAYLIFRTFQPGAVAE